MMTETAGRLENGPYLIATCMLHWPKDIHTEDLTAEMTVDAPA